MQTVEPILFQAGTLKFEIHPSREAAGKAAAMAAARTIREIAERQQELAVVFGTGFSQLSILEFLTSLPDVPWQRVVGFHMDEYVGIEPEHAASFRGYMRKHLTGRLKMKDFYEIDGAIHDAERTCREYAAKLRAADPALCLLGFGENGHLAFNDPADADFQDPLDVKVVTLDRECREQQVAEGWFPSIEAVPPRAITLTIPPLFRIPKLILSVPGSRKAKVVRRVIEEEISTACPATILKTHPDATVYLDRESSAELGDLISWR